MAGKESLSRMVGTLLLSTQITGWVAFVGAAVCAGLYIENAETEVDAGVYLFSAGVFLVAAALAFGLTLNAVLRD